ncbi:MAG: FecR family protein [Ghiorsea sp.]
MKPLIILSLTLVSLCFYTQIVIANEAYSSIESPTIFRVLGDVKVFRANHFERAIRGMKLKKGDEIRTGKRGRAYVDFPDNSRVKLGNRARFLVRDWSESEGIFSSTLRILQGAFRYTAGIVSKGLLSRKTTLTTRTAVLGVRGTDFWGRVGKEDTFLLLLEGEITIAPRNGEEIIYNNAGSAVNINSSTISEPELLSMAVIAPLAVETEIEDYYFYDF